MDKYEHKTSYLTYMQIGSFCTPLGMGIWSPEVSSKHTNSASLYYNIMSLWTANKSHNERKGAMGTQDLGLKHPPIVHSTGRP